MPTARRPDSEYDEVKDTSKVNVPKTTPPPTGENEVEQQRQQKPATPNPQTPPPSTGDKTASGKMGDSSEAQQKASGAATTPVQEAKLVEQLIKTRSEDADRAWGKYESDVNTQRAAIQAAIEEQQAQIARAEANPNKYSIAGGAYDNLKKLQNDLQQLDATYEKNKGKYQEYKKASSAAMWSLLQQTSGKESVLNPFALKVTSGAESKSGTIKSPRGTGDLFKGAKQEEDASAIFGVAAFTPENAAALLERSEFGFESVAQAGRDEAKRLFAASDVESDKFKAAAQQFVAYDVSFLVGGYEGLTFFARPKMVEQSVVSLAMLGVSGAQAIQGDTSGLEKFGAAIYGTRGEGLVELAGNFIVPVAAEKGLSALRGYFEPNVRLVESTELRVKAVGELGESADVFSLRGESGEMVKAPAGEFKTLYEVEPTFKVKEVPKELLKEPFYKSGEGFDSMLGVADSGGLREPISIEGITPESLKASLPEKFGVGEVKGKAFLVEDLKFGQQAEFGEKVTPRINTVFDSELPLKDVTTLKGSDLIPEGFRDADVLADYKEVGGYREPEVKLGFSKLEEGGGWLEFEKVKAEAPPESIFSKYRADVEAKGVSYNPEKPLAFDFDVKAVVEKPKSAPVEALKLSKGRETTPLAKTLTSTQFGSVSLSDQVKALGEVEAVKTPYSKSLIGKPSKLFTTSGAVVEAKSVPVAEARPAYSWTQPIPQNPVGLSYSAVPSSLSVVKKRVEDMGGAFKYPDGSREAQPTLGVFKAETYKEVTPSFKVPTIQKTPDLVTPSEEKWRENPAVVKIIEAPKLSLSPFSFTAEITKTRDEAKPRSTQFSIQETPTPFPTPIPVIPDYGRYSYTPQPSSGGGFSLPGASSRRLGFEKRTYIKGTALSNLLDIKAKPSKPVKRKKQTPWGEATRITGAIGVKVEKLGKPETQLDKLITLRRPKGPTSFKKGGKR